MSRQIIEGFSIIGISVRTTNENEQAAIDIPRLWKFFLSEGIIDKIPNKINRTVYCIYTDYEKDHTKPYTTILGCAVENLNVIPNDMTGIIITSAAYEKFVAKGSLMEGVVFNEWVKIWNSSLERIFTADFEVYDEKSDDSENAEVDIFIAVK